MVHEKVNGVLKMNLNNNNIDSEQIIKSKEMITNLFNEYSKLDSFKNIHNRSKKTSCSGLANKYFIIVLVLLVFFSAGFFFSQNHLKTTISTWVISLVAFILYTIKNIDRLNLYTKEMGDLRYQEMSEILNRNGVDSMNLSKVIEHYKLEIEDDYNNNSDIYTINKLSDLFKSVGILMFGALIQNLISNKFEITNDNYIVFTTICVLVLFLTIFFRIISFVLLRSSYGYKVKKLIIDLKLINALNCM